MGSGEARPGVRGWRVARGTTEKRVGKVGRWVTGLSRGRGLGVGVPGSGRAVKAVGANLGYLLGRFSLNIYAAGHDNREE